MEGGEGENGERERMEGGREWRVCLVGRKDVFCYMGGWLTRCRPILRSLPLPHTRILTHKLSLAHTHPHPHLSRSHDDLTMIDLTALPLIPVTHPTPHPGSPTLPLTRVTHPTPHPGHPPYTHCLRQFAFLFGGEGAAYLDWAYYCRSTQHPLHLPPRPPLPQPNRTKEEEEEVKEGGGGGGEEGHHAATTTTRTTKTTSYASYQSQVLL